MKQDVLPKESLTCGVASTSLYFVVTRCAAGRLGFVGAARFGRFGMEAGARGRMPSVPLQVFLVDLLGTTTGLCGGWNLGETWTSGVFRVSVFLLEPVLGGCTGGVVHAQVLVEVDHRVDVSWLSEEIASSRWLVFPGGGL